MWMYNIHISPWRKLLYGYPLRVADAQPAGAIPDAVAGNGDAEKKSACLQTWFQRTLDTLQGLKKPKLAPD